MKKILAVITVVAVLTTVAALFTGCNSNSIKQMLSGKEPESIAASGGWGLATSPEITDDLQAVFDKATEALAGATLTPVAYIGSQVVAGMNYRFLCKAVATVPDATGEYVVVTIYNDLQNNAEITSIVKNDAEVPESGLMGGWSEAETPVVTDEAKAALEKAGKADKNTTYTPIALVATQVVSGTNYCILCEVNGGYEAFVYVYADLNGKAEITEVKAFTQMY